MPLIVTDSTCLIGLERLDLLPAVFPDVTAPPAVIEEFGTSLGWLAVRPVENQKLNEEALRLAGESE